MSPDEVAAHVEIQQVLYRYCRGVDRGDLELLRSVYHPDAVDRHGAFEGSGYDFAAGLVPRMDQAPSVGQHHITNALIEIHGEAAAVESYFIAYHPLPNEEGGGHAMVCGRYLDRFERRRGAWRIAEREVVIDLSQRLEAGAAWSGAGAFPKGARREADRSATLFKAREAAE